MHWKKIWVADLPDLTLLINKIDELCDDFIPTQFVDSELYIEKLMKMSKELKKKKEDKSTEKTQRIFCNSETITLVIFFFFVCNFLFDLLN